MIVILNFSGQLLLVLIKLTRVCFRPHSQGPLLPGPSLAPGAEQEKEDDVNTLCDKLATDHSVCTGRATSCTHMSLRQIASCVLETFLKSLSLRQNFVAATSRKKKHCATCWGDKILLQPQRFSQKVSSTHEAICRCKKSPPHVAATLVAQCVPTVRILQKHCLV